MRVKRLAKIHLSRLRLQEADRLSNSNPNSGRSWPVVASNTFTSTVPERSCEVRREPAVDRCVTIAG